MFAEIKTYLYGAIAAILIAGGIWYTIHERDIGEQKIEARDVIINTQRTAIATAADLHNKDVEALSQLKSQQIGDHYDEVIHAPIGDSPRVVRIKPASAPASSVLPQTAGSGASNPATANSAGSDSVDIGAPLDEVGRNADAQIKALQDEIQVLIDAMNGKTK